MSAYMTRMRAKNWKPWNMEWLNREIIQKKAPMVLCCFGIFLTSFPLFEKQHFSKHALKHFGRNGQLEVASTKNHNKNNVKNDFKNHFHCQNRAILWEIPFQNNSNNNKKPSSLKHINIERTRSVVGRMKWIKTTIFFYIWNLEWQIRIN